MLRSPAILLVFPVPFAALDARGMPAAAVRFDPPTGRKNEVHFIGCTRQNTLVERRKRAEGRQSVYATSFRYDLAPQRITHTDYHVQRLRQGELIAADAATAKIAGVPFVPPMTAFERARYAAIARWQQQYGEAPPVEAWPELRLVLPDDDSPSTAPAHGVSLRAKAGAPAAAAAIAPPLGAAPAVPAGEAPRAPAPATVFAGTPAPRGAAEQGASARPPGEQGPPAPNAATEQATAAPDAAGGTPT